MRRLSLNDWQLYGLVFSIAWALGAAAYAWQAGTTSGKNSDRSTPTAFQVGNAAERVRYQRSRAADQPEKRRSTLLIGPVFCLILIPFAWLLAYINEWGLRWIIRPFRPWE